MSQNQTLTPQSLLKLATDVVVLRAWIGEGTNPIVSIDLVTRYDSSNPLYWIRYRADLSFRSRFHDTGVSSLGLAEFSLEKQESEPGAQKILDSWKEHTPRFCEQLPAFACTIQRNGWTYDMPVGRLSLVLHYTRLMTWLEEELKTRQTPDENLSRLIRRFDAFLEQRLLELGRLGHMLVGID